VSARALPAGTVPLVRLALRRDRVAMPLWVLALGLLPVGYASAVIGLYPTTAERAAYARSIKASPAELALIGPVFGESAGALAAWRSGFLLVLAGLAGLLTVVRHTRTEEESGRQELVTAAAVGRRAPVTAALLVAAAAGLAAGVVAAAGLAAKGLPPAGSAAFGLGVAVATVTFGAVGALSAQVFEGAGAARSAGVAVLGLAFLLRAAGDAGGGGSALHPLSWLSPFGWVQQVRPFAGDRWWLLLLPAALTCGCIGLALVVLARRDLGSGLRAARPGPATGAPGLRTALVLTWRLDRAALALWVAGLGVFGVVLGAAAPTAAEQIGTDPQLNDLLARLGGSGSVVDAVLASSFSLAAFGGAAYAVTTALRLRGEESGGRAEPLLAAAVPRLAWAGSHLLVAALGAALSLAATGLGAGVAVAAADGDPAAVGRLLVAGLAQVPAAWVLTGVTAALLGLLPGWSSAAWAVLAGFLLLGQVGAALDLAPALLDVSPFTHTPRLPGGDVGAGGLAGVIGLLVVAGLLTAVGLAGLRRRDIPQ
jgi:ABC-2 type transport system permease protein